MLYSFKIKIKAFTTHIVMRLFYSPEKYIKWYVNKKGGSIKTDDNGWIVNQSNDFHKWCYDEGHKIWKSIYVGCDTHLK
jgi:hypothetical protein